MSKAVMILGSNLNDPLKQLSRARRKIEYIERTKIIQCSSVWKTAPWGKQDQPDFYNQVIIAETKLMPQELLAVIHEIEQYTGRVRTEKYGARSLDVDILFYDDLILHEAGLTIPHPRMAERNFVLSPLAEALPDFIHPVFRKTVRQMLHECPDKSAVEKLNLPARD